MSAAFKREQEGAPIEVKSVGELYTRLEERRPSGAR